MITHIQDWDSDSDSSSSSDSSSGPLMIPFPLLQPQPALIPIEILRLLLNKPDYSAPKSTRPKPRPRPRISVLDLRDHPLSDLLAEFKEQIQRLIMKSAQLEAYYGLSEAHPIILQGIDFLEQFDDLEIEYPKKQVVHNSAEQRLYDNAKPYVERMIRDLGLKNEKLDQIVRGLQVDLMWTNSMVIDELRALRSLRAADEGPVAIPLRSEVLDELDGYYGDDDEDGESKENPDEANDLIGIPGLVAYTDRLVERARRREARRAAREARRAARERVSATATAPTLPAAVAVPPPTLPAAVAVPPPTLPPAVAVPPPTLPPTDS